VKQFFRSLSFPRAVILVCMLASVPLAWAGWTRSQRLARVEDELQRVPNVVREIHTLAIQYEKLNERKSGEGLTGEGQLDSYIRRAATTPEVRVGSVDLSPSSKKQGGGIVDNTVSIKPSNKKKAYTRSQLANFFYKLEGDSHRVRVTSLELQPLDTRLKAHEVLDDSWTFSLTITSRQKEE
jgi:hypothetical protein